MKNQIKRFDEANVSFVPDVLGGKTAWYDITDIVGDMLPSERSIFDYASRIQMELVTFYDEKGDKMGYVRDKFEELIKVEEYDCFECTSDGHGNVSLQNDQRRIRVIFNNGAVLIARNSEWGGLDILSR